jgi:hypothetical protein
MTINSNDLSITSGISYTVAISVAPTLGTGTASKSYTITFNCPVITITTSTPSVAITYTVNTGIQTYTIT